MKCSGCKRRYSAAGSQPWPGGSSAPGVFFIAGRAAALRRLRSPGLLGVRKDVMSTTRVYRFAL